MESQWLYILKEYGLGVFLSLCVVGFLWHLIQMIGKLVTSFATQISDERKRWETIVDNHLTKLNERQELTAKYLSEAAITLESINSKHDIHNERQTEEHNQQNTDHTIILERLPSKTNGNKRRTKR